MIATDRPRLAHLGAALILLTRLPVQRLGWRVPEDAFAGAVWAYPVVGAAVGAVGGIGFLLAESWGFPAGPAAVCALTATILLTGALHEDGLADTADGLGGGATPERRLAIMRDSRIGSYGAIALMLMLAARLSALASMADASSAAAAIVVAGAAGRAAMLILVLLLAPARTDGMATGLRGARGGSLALGLLLAGVVAWALLPGGVATRALAGAALLAFGMAYLARAKIGGYTGDILGATSVLAECVVLAVAASI